MIDTERVEAISNISLLRNQKDIQTIMERINLLTRFVPNYLEIFKEITYMLKKHREFKWIAKARD